MQKPRRKQKRKKSLVAKFFIIVLSILAVYFVALAAYIGFTYLNDNEDDDYFKVNNSFLPTALNILPKVPERTNVLLLGVDEDLTRTDTIMIASYNSVAKKISLLSIPRDTLVSVPDDRWELMVENFPQLSGNIYHEVKINAIHNYAGEEKGIEYLELQLEELLDINIDYYARVDCEAFRYLVDSIGGIDYDVPMRMKYSDPTQDLYIDLKPGLQHLDGDQCEQLVRFRKGYAQQDLDRAATQQEFMKVLISTALSKDNIMSNPTAYLNTIIQYVKTNFTVTDAVKYIKNLSDITSANMENYTLPGSAEMINGASYYIVDDEKAEELVYEIFKQPTVAPEDIVKEESFGKSIQILNGGYKSGLAGKTQELLESKGYKVSDIGDYNGSKSSETKIYVSKPGQGEDLQAYFTSSKIIVDESKLEDYDICIILGTKEELIGYDELENENNDDES